ncbi:putative calcium-binding protein [Rivularia sp. PCC 7116]|nr:putative calcium-binding protein [Rivularia sp. PCC 7116]
MGNDKIEGGSGNDRITGGIVSGSSGKDTLTGNEGNDIFELSYSFAEVYPQIIMLESLPLNQGLDSAKKERKKISKPFYAEKGDNDFALIEDFTKGEDKIRILGTSSSGDITSNYSLKKIESSPNVIDTNIYYDEDLIAVVAGNNIELTGDFFLFT